MFASYALRCSGVSAASCSSVGPAADPDISARLASSPCLIAAGFIASLTYFSVWNMPIGQASHLVAGLAMGASCRWRNRRYGVGVSFACSASWRTSARSDGDASSIAFFAARSALRVCPARAACWTSSR